MKSDVWSAAACVVHMAGGCKPFDGMGMAQIAARLLEQRCTPDLPSDIPAGPLRTALMQCFSHAAGQRPAAESMFRLCRQLLAPAPQAPAVAASGPHRDLERRTCDGERQGVMGIVPAVPEALISF